jgi:hypothetical protein
MKAKCRENETNDLFPAKTMRRGDKTWWLVCDSIERECWQPESIANDDYDLIIMWNGRAIFVSSQNFQFINN